MSNHILYEILGYIGTAFALASFMMTSTVKLRIINSIGSSLIGIYSILVVAYPNALCNFSIVAINIYQLISLLHNKNDNYTTIPCSPDSKILRAFVKKYRQDIAKYHPSFEANDPKFNFARFIFSRNEIVGLQMGTKNDEELSIYLDYSTPEYRDCSVGRYAYAHTSGSGIKRVYFEEINDKVIKYIKNVGFVKKEGRYVLEFDAMN